MWIERYINIIIIIIINVSMFVIHGSVYLLMKKSFVECFIFAGYGKLVFPIAVLENSHTHPMESHQKFQWGGGPISQGISNYLNWNFWRLCIASPEQFK